MVAGAITPPDAGVICNCSETVFDFANYTCPPGSVGDHVYGLDLSWRSIYRANGWSPLQGTLSPEVGRLSKLRLLTLRNNLYVSECCCDNIQCTRNLACQQAEWSAARHCTEWADRPWINRRDSQQFHRY